jgi:hypothetical protein
MEQLFRPPQHVLNGVSLSLQLHVFVVALRGGVALAAAASSLEVVICRFKVMVCRFKVLVCRFKVLVFRFKVL